jgi:hypothetical protein
MPTAAITRAYADALRQSLAELTLRRAVLLAQLERLKADYAAGRLAPEDRAAAEVAIPNCERMHADSLALDGMLREHLETVEQILAGREVDPERLRAQVLQSQLAGLGFGAAVVAELGERRQ